MRQPSLCYMARATARRASNFETHYYYYNYDYDAVAVVAAPAPALTPASVVPYCCVSAYVLHIAARLADPLVRQLDQRVLPCLLLHRGIRAPGPVAPQMSACSPVAGVASPWRLGSSHGWDSVAGWPSGAAQRCIPLVELGARTQGH